MAQQAVRKPVLIFGAGISGLTLAQGLRRADVPFIVFEKDLAFESRSQGYRFGLAEPGVVALQSTLPPALFDKFQRTCSNVVPKGPPGTLQAVEGKDGVNPFAKMFAANGKPGGPHAGGGDGKKKPAPPAKVDRRTLRSILVQGLESRMQFGKAFQSFQETEDGVDVTLTDGSIVSGSVLVGADGGWSKIRQQMRPDFTLRDCETRPILGKTPVTPELLETVDASIAQGMTFITGPDFNAMAELMRFDQRVDGVPVDYIFWVLFLKPEHYPDEKAVEVVATDSEALMSFARKATKDWHPSIRVLLEQPGVGASQLQNMTAVPTQLAVNPNASSRVTLMGDSAHFMPPTGGLGASTALKDAALLSQKIQQAGPTAEALRQYEEEMLPYARQAYDMTLIGGRAIFGFKDWEDMPLARLH